MTYLSLDPGLSHIGIAISYEGKIAIPLTTASLKKFTSQIDLLIRQHNPQFIVVGIPAHGPIKNFSASLAKILSSKYQNINIILHSEDLTTKMANKIKTKASDHAAAAALILEDFLLQSN